MNIRSWYSLAEVTIVSIERTENRAAKISKLTAEAAVSLLYIYRVIICKIQSADLRVQKLNADGTITEDQRKNNSC